MKKILLFSVITVSSVVGYAQRVSVGNCEKQTHPVNNSSGFSTANIFERTTASGDTEVLSNVPVTDTPTLYYAGMTTDSGYISGTDVYGDMGFAERYDFATGDSALNVIGVVTLFGGTVNPASTKTVTFYTWNVGPQQATTDPTVFFSGFPNLALDSVTVPITQLGVAIPDTAEDTFKSFYFTTPTGYLNQSFFVGYHINYNFSALAGDTIGVYTSQDGNRASVLYNVSGVDTIINDQNATLYNDGTWHDNATDNFFLDNDYYIFPIVVVHDNLSVKGVTNNSLTFFGNYPNPAVSSTNIRFSLADNTDVTIIITDMNGRTVNTIQQNNLFPGEHIIPVDTRGMNAGDYIYIIHTADGDGVASKMTVVN